MSVASIASIGLLAGVVGLSSLGYIAPSVGGGSQLSGGNGGGRVTSRAQSGVPNPVMREAMKRTRILQEDEELIVLVSAFMRVIQ